VTSRKESVAKLLELQAEFVEDLGVEAIRAARRHDADLVSAADVTRAEAAVRGAATRTGRMEAFGGVLAGAGVGTFLQLAVEDDPSILGLSIAAVIAAIGLVVLAAALFGRR
jgi:hypothetical protein